jgi:hypothetical protein
MNRRDVIYIAGPMTGIADYNYPAFHEAARAFRKEGWTVLNPAESFGGRQDLEYHQYMHNAVELVNFARAIALLPGWEKSPGALMEVLIGVRQGYEFFDAITGEFIDAPNLKVTVA